MAVYALGDRVPSIDPTAFVHPEAVVIGDVRIGPDSSVWYNCVIRGDANRVVIGARTNIQDGSVIHATLEMPTHIGDGCVVGHLVHMECCTVEDGALVGSGSIVLHRAIVRSGALVGAARLAGLPAEYRELRSTKGHDGFLTEWDQLTSVIGEIPGAQSKKT